jgi:cobyrinic acid a,c-diamide synthase
MNELDRPPYPRLVIAGIAGDSGKTLVSLGLTLLARERGLEVATFKKGPDFIDAAWLSWASGRPSRNLDSFLMGFPEALASFLRHASPQALNVIEGNRGLYDGLDSDGTHSTAKLSKTLRSPVVLVLNAAKMTRTAAALVLGCMTLDRGVHLGGVVLNNVAGTRHLEVLRSSIEKTCGIPVLGALPRIRGDSPLPDRHLGLLPPQEHSGISGLGPRIADICRPHLDVDGLLALARTSTPLATSRADLVSAPPAVTVGFLSDGAFTFYYPDNLEALARAGARLLPVSPLSGLPFPSGLDALYIGGGFPETHARELAACGLWMEGLRLAVEGGLPVYAECGGLMFLSQSILWQGSRFPMAGVLPFDVEVLKPPQGHGYSEIVVDADNPFFPQGTRLRGHEFHYSRLLGPPPALATACRVERGTGCLPGREAVIKGNVWASYTHLHALASPEWAPGLVASAMKFREGKGGR